MRLHCSFCNQPPRHWSEAHGYLCDGCWWYSDEALTKQHRVLTWRNLLGYMAPRTPGVPCKCCGCDSRPEAFGGGDGTYCGLCLDRGHAEDDD